MTEILHYDGLESPRDAVNPAGDIVLIEDIDYDPTADFDDAVEAAFALDSIAAAREKKRLDSLVNHPAMSGEAMDRMRKSDLGIAARAALDNFYAQRDELRGRGASDRKANTDLMRLLATKAKLLGITPSEVNTIISIVSPAVVKQKTRFHDYGDDASDSEPEYRDAQSAAANDRS